MVYPNPLDLPSKPPLPHLTLSLDMCWQGPIIKQGYSTIPSHMFFYVFYLFLKAQKPDQDSVKFYIHTLIQQFDLMKKKTVKNTVWLEMPP